MKDTIPEELEWVGGNWAGAARGGKGSYGGGRKREREFLPFCLLRKKEKKYKQKKRKKKIIITKERRKNTIIIIIKKILINLKLDLNCVMKIA